MRVHAISATVAGTVAIGLLVLVGLGRARLETALAFIGGSLLPVIRWDSHANEDDSPRA